MRNICSRFSYLAIVSILCLSILCVGGYILWIKFKPQPAATQGQLFEGIEYIRDVRNTPRNIVIHVIKVDLYSEGIHILVTPGSPRNELPVKARTTSEFLNIFGLQVAINGDGFTPWHSNSLLDYYPHSGDPVNPIGLAASEGIAYSQETDNEPTLYLSASNKTRINTPIGKLYNAISGNRILVQNGKTIPNLGGDNPDPRTAVALDRANRHLILLVVDGRQPGYSEGVTLNELADIIIFHDGHNAINLDGGGSSTLAIESSFGSSKLINSPINHGIPGRQRPVGNHLGIFAKPIKE